MQKFSIFISLSKTSKRDCTCQFVFIPQLTWPACRRLPSLTLHQILILNFYANGFLCPGLMMIFTVILLFIILKQEKGYLPCQRRSGETCRDSAIQDLDTSNLLHHNHPNHHNHRNNQNYRNHRPQSHHNHPKRTKAESLGGKLIVVSWWNDPSIKL